MNGKFCSIAVLVATASLLLCFSGCGHNQELVSIDIQPSTETFGSSTTPVSENAGSQVQLKAMGTYVHPPVTKDITNLVTWFSNTPQMVTVNSTGLITATGRACGGTLISATVQTNADANGQNASGAIVTGTMTANVVCFTGNGGGGEPALTVTFLGSGSGTVTSTPPGVNCPSPSPCVDPFASGTTIMLQANPSPTSQFGSWSGCDSPGTSNPCTVNLASNRTVIATFN